MCHGSALGMEKAGTGWAQTEFELSKSKAIDGDRLSRNEFSIALREFESRAGHCRRPTHFVPPFVAEGTGALGRRCFHWPVPTVAKTELSDSPTRMKGAQ